MIQQGWGPIAFAGCSNNNANISTNCRSMVIALEGAYWPIVFAGLKFEVLTQFLTITAALY